jgi:maltokinase
VTRGRLPAGLVDVLPGHLGAQRWYSGADAPSPDSVSVESSGQLWASDEGLLRLWHAVVAVGEHRYQLLLGERNTGDLADFLQGRDDAVLGAFDGSYFYDATLDSDLARALLTVASSGTESATLARSSGAEQTNTSIVFDDRLILKVFRRLHQGANPDIEITTALAGAGFEHVAAPLVAWRDNGYDLAFGQEFLTGGSEGWALALTSLRDLFVGAADVPSEAGGDFSAEARRLGRVTAEMHLTMASIFGTVRSERSRESWRHLVDGLHRRVREAAAVVGREVEAAAAPLFERLGSVDDQGPVLRVHGDFHLGQVMRTDNGWYVLDFEGEPTKPLSERRELSSVLKDVTGMLRSFDYASRYGVVEHAAPDWDELEPLASAWESHNRQAFLEGYQETPGVDSLLPQPESAAAVTIAYELDKALYELDYELRHRPAWVSIPNEAVARLIYGGRAA